MSWRVQRATSTGQKQDDKKLERLLAEGWEPFACTQTNGYAFVYHLRKSDKSNGE